MSTILQVENLARSYGEKNLFENISFVLSQSQKVALIARNGAGKTSLLNIIAGLEPCDEGSVSLFCRDSFEYLRQDPQLEPSNTVFEEVYSHSNDVQKTILNYEHVIKGNDKEEIQRAIGQMDAIQGWEYETRVKQILTQLKLPDLDQRIRELSGGQRKRVALAKALITEPAFLILDEPTNHLDAESVAWLERHLKAYKGSVILVTHDRYFLDNVTGWILELDRGHGIPWQGNYAQWLDQKLDKMKNEEKGESDRQKRLAREQEWVKSNPKARQAKSKARLNAYDDLLAQDRREQVKVAQIMVANGKRLGDVVIEANGIKKGYDDKLLYEDLSFKLPRSGIVGIIGPNGAGKTTLFKMILGQETPDAGSFKLGETVEIISMEQGRESLANDNTVYQEITDGRDEILIGDRKMNARAYCGLFNFAGADQQKKLSQLSGGMRNRVLMAKNLQKAGNLLLLDEPTNDLDIETLQALEQAILNFAGCAVVISHDRWFLDRIATHIIAFEGDSKVVWFEGNWTEYEANYHKRMGTDADNPKPIKYKTLTR